VADVTCVVTEFMHVIVEVSITNVNTHIMLHPKGAKCYLQT